MGRLFGFQTVYPFDYLTSRHPPLGAVLKGRDRDRSFFEMTFFLLNKLALFVKIPNLAASTRIL